jgi:hypothetical protein
MLSWVCDAHDRFVGTVFGLYLLASEAVIQLGQKTRFDPEMVISTGSLTVDRALGIGGLPKGYNHIKRMLCSIGVRWCP